jgi:hypothetical protein
MSAAGRVAGALFLVAAFVAVEALVLSMRGLSPRTVTPAALGAFLGLVSLAVEIGLLERSARTFHAQGVQTTFISFVMRLGTVAPVTLLLMKPSLGMDAQSFALSYCGTFFLYLCWLTWETYRAPVHYRPRATESNGDGVIIVKDRRGDRQRAPTTR